MFEIIKAIILGIIQGITEWLPISSTGHMILFNEIWPLTLSEEFVNLFLVVIQLGSILAVLTIYFKKLNPFSPSKTEEEKKDTWSLWSMILVACLPAAICGVLFDDMIDAVLYNGVTVATTLIIYGVLFIVIENSKIQPKIGSLRDISIKTAIMIGAFQMLALIPGTSRSGSTILGASLLGCTRAVAAEFSFFMAIPMMFGASGLKLLKYVLSNGLSFSAMELLVLVVGMVVAFAVSVFAIKFLMKYIKKNDFKAFGYYRIVLGLVVIAYFLLLK